MRNSGGSVPTNRIVCAASQGSPKLSGDALVVRCGWEFTPDPARSSPGLSIDAVRWMHQRGVSVYAGDLGDAFPALDPAVPFPLHVVALTRLGVPLIDAANVEDLAATCTELGRHSFLLVAAPPRVNGTTGCR
ncbi:cyclase family protein [Amycolatopsis sp. NPDC051373]|uniref:cyclase family protein n=1 Tax=Amycolatopsis sp. NPDC051373 TaxID=3155801 RepID=UPI00344B2EF7